MAPSYATPTDLAAWLPDDVAVAEPARLLARATELLDDHVRTPFALADDGLPSHAPYREALRGACCAQVEFWAEVGEEHDTAGMGGRQVQLLSLSMQELPPELAPRARRLLSTAGLLAPVVTGAQPLAEVWGS